MEGTIELSIRNIPEKKSGDNGIGTNLGTSESRNDDDVREKVVDQG